MPVHRWASRIRSRNHHRLVHETSENTNAYELGYSRSSFDRVRAEFPQLDFQWDHASASIHNLLLPDDMDQGDLIRFPVMTASGAARPIGEQSHILRRIPRRFQIARIFCDFAGADPQTRAAVRQFAADQYHSMGGRP